MKTVRIFSVFVVLALLVTAVVSFAAAALVGRNTSQVMLNSPVQTLVDAARGLPLLAPMNLSAPLISMSVQNNTSSDYACTLIKQSPKDWTLMQSRQYFDMKWNVQNTGNAVWHAKATTFAYVGGTKMQTRGDAFDLGKDVGRGKKTRFVIDMTAPAARGTYSTLWALYSGSTRFCKLTMTLTVNR